MHPDDIPDFLGGNDKRYTKKLGPGGILDYEPGPWYQVSLSCIVSHCTQPPRSLVSHCTQPPRSLPISHDCAVKLLVCFLAMQERLQLPTSPHWNSLLAKGQVPSPSGPTQGVDRRSQVCCRPLLCAHCVPTVSASSSAVFVIPVQPTLVHSFVHCGSSFKSVCECIRMAGSH